MALSSGIKYSPEHVASGNAHGIAPRHWHGYRPAMEVHLFVIVYCLLDRGNRYNWLDHWCEILRSGADLKIGLT